MEVKVLQPFNGPSSGNTRVSCYKKSKTSLDLLEKRSWQWHLLDHEEICTSTQR